MIALEPEAASIYCRKLRIHHLVPDAPPRLSPYKDPPNVTPVMEGVEDGEKNRAVSPHSATFLSVPRHHHYPQITNLRDIPFRTS